ncbi:MAG: tetratricopeptide repeat protein [Magnetococcales bacterium]|nr:tetratricopeptide repeat protein [Magnetococcales bacterium]
MSLPSKAEAECLRGNCVNGFGTFLWSSGARYDGEFYNGTRHGAGSYLFADGSLYVGEYLHGVRHGKGTFVWASGKKYVGEWVNGHQTGYGIKTWPDGRRQAGQFLNDTFILYAKDKPQPARVAKLPKTDAQPVQKSVQLSQPVAKIAPVPVKPLTPKQYIVPQGPANVATQGVTSKSEVKPPGNYQVGVQPQKQVQPKVQAQVPAPIPAKVQAQVPAPIPAKVEAQVPAPIPAKVEAQVPASIPVKVQPIKPAVKKATLVVVDPTLGIVSVSGKKEHLSPKVKDAKKVASIPKKMADSSKVKVVVTESKINRKKASMTAPTVPVATPQPKLKIKKPVMVATLASSLVKSSTKATVKREKAVQLPPLTNGVKKAVSKLNERFVANSVKHNKPSVANNLPATFADDNIAKDLVLKFSRRVIKWPSSIDNKKKSAVVVPVVPSKTTATTTSKPKRRAKVEKPLKTQSPKLIKEKPVERVAAKKSLPVVEANNVKPDKSRSLEPSVLLIRGYYSRGLKELSAGRYRMAVASFDEALIEDYMDVDALIGRGQAYLKLANYNRAIQDFNQVLGIAKNSARVLVLRGSAYRNIKEYTRSLKDLNKGIKLSPKVANGYYERGLTKSDMGRFEDAQADFNKALNIDEKLFEVYIARGRVLAKMGKYAAAISDFNIGINKFPKIASYYFVRATAYAASGEASASLQDYNKAISLTGDEAVYYFARAFAYQDLRQLSKMCIDLKSACNLGDKQGCQMLKKECNSGE